MDEGAERPIDFFISRAGADAAFAAEIGRILEDAGHGVDPPAMGLRQPQLHGTHARVARIRRPGDRASVQRIPRQRPLRRRVAQRHRPRPAQQAGPPDRPAGERMHAHRTAHRPRLLGPRAHPGRPGAAARRGAGGGRARAATRARPPRARNTGARPAPWSTGTSRRRPASPAARPSSRAIDAALRSGGAAAVTQPVAVHGLGGIGKSVLAREYAHRNQESYAGVWWLNAAKPDDAAGFDGIETALVDLGIAVFYPRPRPGPRPPRHRPQGAGLHRPRRLREAVAAGLRQRGRCPGVARLGARGQRPGAGHHPPRRLAQDRQRHRDRRHGPWPTPSATCSTRAAGTT